MGINKVLRVNQNQNETLIRVVQEINTAPDLKPVLDQICYEVAYALDLEAVSIFFQDEVSNTLLLAAEFGLAERLKGKIPTLPYHIFAEAITNSGFQLVIPDINELQNQMFISFCSTFSMTSVIFTSINIETKITGTLVGNSFTNKRIFDEDDMRLLRLLADLIATAIQKSRLSQEYRRRTRELEMLTLVSSSLRLAEKSEDMLPILVNNAREVFSADVVTFYLEEARLRPLAGVMPLLHAYPAPENSRDVLFVSRDHPIWKIASSGPLPLYLTVDELKQMDGAELMYPNLEKLHAFALSSVKIADGVIALLFLGFCSPHIFPDDERRLLEALSEMGGNALQRAGMMETLEQRVADRTHELGALYNVAKVASEYSDLKVILEKSLDNVLTIIGCNIGYIHLLEEDGTGIDLTVQQTNPPDAIEQIQLSPMKLRLWEKVIEKNSPLLITDPELNEKTEIVTEKRADIYLGVPIHAKGKTFGVLSIFRNGMLQFNQEEIALLSAIADQMGVAVESAHLRKQAERAAVMEERQRLARELHDAVSQSLYSLTLLAEACRQSIHLGNMENVDEWINDISHTSHDALKEMRLLLYELRPSMIEKDGFIGAIKHRLEAVESRAGITTHLNITGECQLPIPIAEQLYRIVQEALNNTLKHSSATDVIIDLKFDLSGIKLDIIDNGIGLNPEKDFSKGGLGFSTMKERAEKLGGVFVVESSPGSGTKISITLETENAK